VSYYPDQAQGSFEWNQVDENHIAQFVVVNEPALPNWMGSCHPNGSLYEKPLDLRAAQKEHERFREELMNNGCIVRTVREILAQDCDVDVMARERLEELAMGSMTYVLAKSPSGLDDQDLTITERQLLSPEYKKSCIEKMDVEQLVEVVLTRPTIVLEKADKDTELLVVNYTYEPLVNLIFCRDQQITTAKGVVMGRPRSRIRQREVEVMEFCFHKLGVPVIDKISSPGTLEGGDFFPAGADLAFLGIGLRSNMDAAQYLLDHDLFGTQRVAIVKDYFDQHQQRMHLDTVFNIIAPKVCLMLKDIQGLESPKRRLVDEYKKNERGEYVLHRHDVEFLQYVQEQGYTVITLTNDMQIAYGCNGLNLGNNTLITVDRMTAKYIARSGLFKGKIICVDFSNNTNMFGSVHCCSQVISRRAAPVSSASRASLEVPSPSRPLSAPLVTPSSAVAAVALKSANLATRYLMIAPNNFDVNAVTAQDNMLMAASHERFNRQIHTKGRGRRDVHAMLVAEFTELHRVLTVTAGVDVHLFTHETFHNAPDAMFVVDWFSTHSTGDNKINPEQKSLVLLPMKAPTRRHERRADLVQFLHQYYPHVLNLAPCEMGKLEALSTTLETPVSPSGDCKPLEGSAFVMDRESRLAFAGRTCTRLDLETLSLWAEKTGYTPVIFDFDTQSSSPHAHLLKSAHHTRVFLAVFSNVSFVCSEAIAPQDRDRVLSALRRDGKQTLIEFTLAQCASLAITGAFEVFSPKIGKPVIILSKSAHDAFTQAQRDTISKIGSTIEVVNMPEIEQLGGGSVSGLIGSLY
jgi:arginine deiminase